MNTQDAIDAFERFAHALRAYDEEHRTYFSYYLPGPSHSEYAHVIDMFQQSLIEPTTDRPYITPILMPATPATLPPTYEATPEDIKELQRRFTYHKPSADQVQRITFLRQKFHALSWQILLQAPRSRERSMSLTHLQEASMNVNAAITIHEEHD